MRPPTLADLGVSKESAQARQLASICEEKFEEVVAELKEEAVKSHTGVTAGAVLRKVNPDAEKRPDERRLEVDRF